MQHVCVAGDVLYDVTYVISVENTLESKYGDISTLDGVIRTADMNAMLTDLQDIRFGVRSTAT